MESLTRSEQATYCSRGVYTTPEHITGRTSTQFEGTVSDAVHTLLDGAGLIPGAGVVFDLLNAGYYAIEEDYGNAALAGVAAIPLFGTVATAGKFADNVADGARVAARSSDEAGEFVNLANPSRTRHILDGEIPRDNLYLGGHRAGTGYPGKSEFPALWSDAQTMHHISDVATSPGSSYRAGRPGDIFATGSRDGVDIEVLVRNGEIWTAYPTNVPRNP